METRWVLLYSKRHFLASELINAVAEKIIRKKHSLCVLGTRTGEIPTLILIERYIFLWNFANKRILGVVTVLKSCIGEDYFWNDEELGTNSWQIDKYFSLQELISHPKTTSDCWRWTIFTENVHLSMSRPRPLGCSSPWIFKTRHQVHFLYSSWLNVFKQYTFDFVII